MKKLAYIIPLVVLSFMAIAPAFVPAFAQITTQQNAPQEKDLGGWLQVVSDIARWLYTIILVVAVIMVLYAAFLYLTAGGDQAKVKKASNTLIFAVIGIVVAILAFSISRIVTGIIK